MKKEINHDDEKRIKVSTLAYSILIIFAAISLVVCILAYGTNSSLGQKSSKIFSKILPMPASIINTTHFVMVNEMEGNIEGLVRYYQSSDFSKSGIKYDFASDDGKKQIEIMKKYVLSKMIQDKVIELLAAKRGIDVSQGDIKNFMDQKMKAYATQDDVIKMLKENYGWTLEDFTNKIVLPSARLTALESEIEKNELNNADAKKKIAQAKDALLKKGDFAAVAKEFSDGQSKNNGGELGWVEKTKMIPELQEAVWSQNTAKSTDIIESSIGYHLIEIEGKKKENNADVVQLRQIFVAKQTFSDWLTQQMKGMSILVPLGEFTWNKEEGIVEFKSQEMKDFEKNQLSSSTGITSVMFQ